MVKDKQELCVLFSVALFLPLLQTAQKVDLDTCTMCVRVFVCVCVCLYTILTCLMKS